MDDVGIIHVPAIAFDPERLLDVVVDCIGIKDRADLTHLAAQAQADISLKTVDKMLGQGVGPVILDHVSEHLQQDPVVDGSKVIAIIHEQDPAGPAVFLIVLPKVLA